MKNGKARAKLCRLKCRAAQWSPAMMAPPGARLWLIKWGQDCYYGQVTITHLSPCVSSPLGGDEPPFVTKTIKLVLE